MKQNGDLDARNELIEHNLRFVSHIIKKYYSNYDEQENLISIGTIGLIKAIDNFGVNKGIFMHFLKIRIFQLTTSLQKKQ